MLSVKWPYNWNLLTRLCRWYIQPLIILLKRIYKACKGFGTDEKALIDALAKCTPEQRCKVEKRYEEVHGKELKKVMKSECGNRDFGTALQLLSLPPDEAEVEIIIRACKGMGTNELVLFPVVCGRSNKEIEHLKKKFFEVHSKDLGKYLVRSLLLFYFHLHDICN